MLRKDPFITGEYYHIYNRGIDKRAIFTQDGDYKRFLMLLYLSNSDESFKLNNLINKKKYSFDEILTTERREPSGGLLHDSIFRVRVHIKDVDGTEYEQYLPSVITVDVPDD